MGLSKVFAIPIIITISETSEFLFLFIRVFFSNFFDGLPGHHYFDTSHPHPPIKFVNWSETK